MQQSLVVQTDKKKAGNVCISKIRNELHKNRILYIMAIPVFLYFILFLYLPMFGVVIAFKNYEVSKGILKSSWVGFKYFIDFFKSIYFIRVMKNTFLISFYDLLFGFPAPIIFALLLNEIKSQRFKKTVQTITYLPHFISIVVICGIIADFFSSNGIITSIISVFGGEKMNYIGSAKYFRSIYVGTGIWQSIGWNSIIYLAALSSIDPQLYEAAVVDGAGKFKQLIKITLPGIMPTISILLIMRLGQMLSVGYEKIILLYGPGTYQTADVISSFVYRYGLGQTMQYSYASAVGIFQSVINLIILVSANKISKRISETSLF